MNSRLLDVYKRQELFFGQKNFDVSIFLPVLDDLIDGNSDNIAKVEHCLLYTSSESCHLFVLKKPLRIDQTKILSAIVIFRKKDI